MKRIVNLVDSIKGKKKETNAKKQEILQSKEYLALKVHPHAQEVFERYYQEEVLDTYSIDQLQAVQRCLPYVSKAIETLIEFLQYGDVTRIDVHDAPNFLNADTLRKILKKYKIGYKKQENVSNLGKNDFLKLFDKTLIHSYEDYESCDHKEDCDYCISIKDIQKHTKHHKNSLRNSLLKVLLVLCVNVIYVIVLKNVAYTTLGIFTEVILLIISFLYLALE